MYIIVFSDHAKMRKKQRSKGIKLSYHINKIRKHIRKYKRNLHILPEVHALTHRGFTYILKMQHYNNHCVVKTIMKGGAQLPRDTLEYFLDPH